jgi:hypothetical protein
VPFTVARMSTTHFDMAAQKSYLIIGQLPTSPLFTLIQSKHDITHIPTKDAKRADVVAQIAQLPQKSYTFALFVSDIQHIYPIDKTLMGLITAECLCKVGMGFGSMDVDYFASRGTWSVECGACPDSDRRSVSEPRLAGCDSTPRHDSERVTAHDAATGRHPASTDPAAANVSRTDA